MYHFETESFTDDIQELDENNIQYSLYSTLHIEINEDSISDNTMVEIKENLFPLILQSYDMNQ